MNNLTINGIKLCKSCNQEKALSEFRLRKAPNNRPSYGKCSTCERTYDYFRRRQKGISIITLRKEVKKPIIVLDSKDKGMMRTHVYSRIKRYPMLLKTCNECNALYHGTAKRKYCSDKCGDKHDHRTQRRKERARMRLLKVDNVDPIKVFEQHQWHCAYCNVYTPRHLKGKQNDDSPELDHIIPLSKGGQHSYANTQLLCRKCNAIKSDKIVLRATG